MNKQDSTEASTKYFEGEEVPQETQYLQCTMHPESSRVDRKDNAMNEISVIKTVGHWIKAHPLQTTAGNSFQTGQDSSSFKKKRNFFTCFQKLELEQIFVHNPYPSKEMCEYLALRFESTPYSMKIWFKNRRARHRKSSSSQPCCEQQPPMPFHQVYYPRTVRKEPFSQPKQTEFPSVILDPHDHRSAFSMYVKTEKSEVQE